ncbi:MAG TPA: hypothetical protein VIH25_06775 [Steroidobacteraceae bacterium]
MVELIKVFVDIALLRKGPQDLPSSALLLLVIVAIYCGFTLTFGRLLPSPEQSFALRTAVELALGLGWIWAMLAIFGRAARFLQTATAMFGTSALLTPPVLGLLAMVLKIGQTNPLAVPLLFALLGVLVWYVLITAHILRSALELRLFVAIILTLLYMGCEYFITTRVLTAIS